MSHIVNDCLLTSFPGGITTVQLAGDEATKWLQARSAVDKKKKGLSRRKINWSKK